jgi:8-oxo-dGTP pyrophosphatase MutT (NUDIX family)
MLEPRPDSSRGTVGGSGPAGHPPVIDLSGPRRRPYPAPPWAEVAAAGWRPTVRDVRRGFTGAAQGRPVEPLVPASRASAILLLVVPGEGAGNDEAHVVLIERSRSSGTHRGDIAFPGGVLHPGERAEAAALRETQEEIGVRPEEVEVIACLDMVATQTGFLISPFVGVMTNRPTFVVDRNEVERVFLVPLADLIRDGAHWHQTWSADPHSMLPFFAVGDAVGWGTTGALLVHLLTVAAAGSLMEER